MMTMMMRTNPEVMKFDQQVRTISYDHRYDDHIDYDGGDNDDGDNKPRGDEV